MRNSYSTPGIIKYPFWRMAAENIYNLLQIQSLVFGGVCGLSRILY